MLGTQVGRRPKLLFFAAIAIASLSIGTFTIARLLTRHHPRGEIIQRWKRRTFVPIGTRIESRAIASRLQVDLATPLSSREHDRLVDTLADVFGIYKDGDYQQFVSFVRTRRGILSAKVKLLRQSRFFQVPLGHFPVPPDPDTPLKSEAAKEFPRKVFRGTAWPPRTDSECFAAVWRLTYFGKGAWRAISLDDARAEVCAYDAGLLSNISINEQLKEKAKQVGGLAQRVARGYIEFPQTTGSTKMATIFFVAEHYPPDPPWPYMIYLRFEPSVDNWVIERVGSLYASKRCRNSKILF